MKLKDPSDSRCDYFRIRFFITMIPSLFVNSAFYVLHGAILQVASFSAR